MKKVNLLLFSLVTVFTLLSCSTERKFSTCSETEQEVLYAELSERLDRYFISAFQNNKSDVLRMLDDERDSFKFVDIYGMLGETNAMLETLLVEMHDVCEQWADDHNLDFEDWGNYYAESFGTYYGLHLMDLLMELGK